MTMNPIVARHLREARAELLSQIDAFQRDVAQIDSMLQGYDSGADPSPAAPRRKKRTLTKPDAAPSMRQIVMDFITAASGDVTTAEVVERVTEQKPEWEATSVRSLLARLVKVGDLISVRRGVYRLAPEDASDPAKAGSEDPITTTKEGGGAGDPTSHDPDHAATGWNRDRGGHPAMNPVR